MHTNLTKVFYLMLSPILGKKAFQYFFEKLFLFSLAGMNYGLVVPGNSGEKYVMEYISNKLRKKSRLIIFDVGANKGYYTENVLMIMGRRVRAYCFEPLKEANEILMQKFDLNRQVKIFNIGFSDKPGRAVIHYDEGSSELASLYDRRVGAISLPVPLDKKEIVTLSTVDSFCLRNKVLRVDLLKIDAEGHDLKVLIGAKGMIKSGKINYIQFEFGGVMIDSRTFFIDFFSLLNPHYRLYRILQDGLHEIKLSSEKHEIFLIGNYLAINRNLTK